MGKITFFVFFQLLFPVHAQFPPPLLSFPPSFCFNNLVHQDFVEKLAIPQNFVLKRESAYATNCLRTIPSMNSPFDQSVLKYLNRTQKILGTDPEEGQVATTGMLGILIQAYQTRVIADERILTWVKLAQEQEDHELRARKLGREAQILTIARTNCTLRDEWDTYLPLFVRKLFKSVHLHTLQEPLHCFERSTRVAARRGSLEDRIWNAYAYAMFMLSITLDVANNFEAYDMDGRRPQFAINTFKRMYEDSVKSERSIENNFEELQRRLDIAIGVGDQPSISSYNWRLDYFRAKQEDLAEKYPYLFNSSTVATKTYGKPLLGARLEAYEQFKVSTQDCSNYYQNAVKKGYIREDNEVNRIIQSESAEWDLKVWEPVNKFFDLHLDVGTKRTDTDKDPNPQVFHDGLFEYDLTKPLQNSKVGQDLLDRFDEEMKCLLRKNYWFDVVNRTMSRMQGRFETKQIFSHWSNTLYTLCEKTETDLIGGCSVENHEMCVPAFFSEDQQTRINENQDLSYHKPKWVFFRTEGKTQIDFTCEGERTYIIPLNVCRCGVRLDCGSDLKEDIKCVLVENDNIRRQCKGSIGYPCESLPLAPGRHDESCVTGYCKMAINQCAEVPEVFE